MQEEIQLPDDRTRFECELDFVTMLQDTKFIEYLSKHFFEDPSFVAWIEYLQYWRASPYIRFVNPISLFFLEQLASAEFRQNLNLAAVNDGIAKLTNLHYFRSQINRMYRPEKENLDLHRDQVDYDERK